MKYIFIALILFTAINNFTAEEIEVHGFSGTLAFSENSWFLINEQRIPLDFGPDPFLESIGFRALPNSEIHVQGFFMDNALIVISSLYNENEFHFRNDSLEPLWTKEIENLENIYEIDRRKCISCRLCLPVCPTGAISFSRGTALIDQEKCVKCGTCLEPDGELYNGCPVDAIIKKTVDVTD